MDEKQEKFERLAQKRVTEAIRILRLIGNLANKRNYSYTETHSKQIIDALESEMRNLKNRFKQECYLSVETFSFHIDKGTNGEK